MAKFSFHSEDNFIRIDIEALTEDSSPNQQDLGHALLALTQAAQCWDVFKLTIESMRNEL